MRKAKVENKYNLKFNDLKKLKVIISNNKKPPTFSRCVNNIKGWQFSENTAKTKADREYASYSSYQIIIYDEGIKKDRVEVTCSAFGDICNYLFDEFWFRYW